MDWIATRRGGVARCPPSITPSMSAACAARPGLLAARAARRRGELGAAELRDTEDRAALDAIELQRQAGMPVFTDGEVRRENWMDGLLASIGGVVGVERPHVRWHREGGTRPAWETPTSNMVAANAAVTQQAQHTTTEAAFLARHAPGPFKITMISSSMGGLMWDPELSASVYPTPADLVRDLAALQVKEIEGLIDQGVTWIQLDSLSYNQVFDAQFRSQARVPGLSPDDILAASVAIDGELVRGSTRNRASPWECTSAAATTAAPGWPRAATSRSPSGCSARSGVDRFLLEYDTERAGGFEPLRFIRPGTTVVLGLVSSKVPQLESQDGLRRRIDEAARLCADRRPGSEPAVRVRLHVPGQPTDDGERRATEARIGGQSGQDLGLTSQPGRLAGVRATGGGGRCASSWPPSPAHRAGPTRISPPPPPRPPCCWTAAPPLRAGAGTGCLHGVAWYARTLGTVLLGRSPPTRRSRWPRRWPPRSSRCGTGTPELLRPGRAAHPGLHGHRGPRRARGHQLPGTVRLQRGRLREGPAAAGDHRPAPGGRRGSGRGRAGPSGILPLEGLRGVALLSDGATRIDDLYRQLGWPAMIDVIREHGPAALIRQVRAAEDADPDRERWPRYKARDDATVVYWPQPG